MELFVPMILVICLGIFWIYQFAQLMLLGDADFPGRYDKILWGVAFFLLFAPAPVAFVLWKRALVMVRTLERQQTGPSPG
jgi:hypothetical protein